MCACSNGSSVPNLLGVVNHPGTPSLGRAYTEEKGGRFYATIRHPKNPGVHQPRPTACGGLDIQTYRSTDAGVAFLVEVEGKTIFHAGDLHWWHWAEEDAAWNQAMERDFKKECAKLQGKPVDVGFFVLDPRQEGEFWWGFDWWMRTMEVKHAFPMHSWEDYTLVQTLRTLPCSAPYRDRVVEVSGKGQVFSWED